MIGQIKEQEEYQDAVKKVQELGIRIMLSNNGIDSSKVPRQKLDEIARLDRKIQEVRQKINDNINKIQRLGNEEIMSITNEIQNTVGSLMKQYTGKIPTNQSVQPIEVKVGPSEQQEIGKSSDVLSDIQDETKIIGEEIKIDEKINMVNSENVNIDNDTKNIDNDTKNIDKDTQTNIKTEEK